MRLRRTAINALARRAVCLQMDEKYKEIPMDKEVKDLVEVAINAGWKVVPIAGSKIRWTPPDKNINAVVTSERKGNGNTWKNALGHLARAGLDVSSAKGYTTPKTTIAEAINPEIAAAMPSAEKAIKEAKELWSPDPKMVAFDQMFADFMRDTLSAGLLLARAATLVGDSQDDEALALIEKYEKEATEASEALAMLQAKHDRLAGDFSRLGSELQEARQKCVAETERANRAENKLRMFRTALQED